MSTVCRATAPQLVLNFDLLDPHELNVSLAKEALAELAEMWPATAQQSSKQQAVVRQLEHTLETGCCD